MSGPHNASTYNNHGCRCETCTDGHREQIARRRAERYEIALPDDDPRHGKVTTYQNWGCRCDRCRAAQAAASRRHRKARSS